MKNNTSSTLIKVVSRTSLVLLYFYCVEATANETGKPTVTYCADPDWMPYEAIRAGKHVGIAADYMNILSQSTGLNLQLVPTSSWDETLLYLQLGKCELGSLLNKTDKRKAYLEFSEPIFESANVFVSKSDLSFVAGYENIGSRTLGIVKNYRHAEYVARYYPEISVQLVESENDGLLALAAGNIDVFIGSMLSVSAHIQKFGNRDLKIVGLAKPYDKLSVGIIKSRSDLLPIINQAIANIPEEQHVEIFRRWNNVQVIDEVDYRYVISAALLFVFIVALISWRNFYVMRFNRKLLAKNNLLEALQTELLEKNKRLEFLSNHDPLTTIYNRHFMISRCKDEILRMRRFSQKSCLILFDLDYFKQINDQFGHSVGDTVLKQIALLVKNEIRDIDIFARWGGEEFLILCPQTTAVETEKLTTRLSRCIEHMEFEGAGHLTCSFGIAEYRVSESFVEWFDRTDNALYQAKNQGRNAIVMAN